MFIKLMKHIHNNNKNDNDNHYNDMEKAYQPVNELKQ